MGWWRLRQRIIRWSRFLRFNFGRWSLKVVLWFIAFTTLFSGVYRLIKLPPAIRQYIPDALRGIVISTEIDIWVLFVIAGLSGAFAIYTEDLLRRLKKLPGGVELATGGAIADILSAPASSPPLREGGPRGKLSPEERVYYERGIHVFWSLELSGLDPSTLRGQERKNYVEVISKTGYYAYESKDYSRAIQFLRTLEDVHPLPKKELSLLAGAYLWGADGEELNENVKARYRREAVRLYELALEEDKYNISALYNLAWAYDEVGLYDKAIEANEMVLRLAKGPRERYSGPARYNVVCACTKSGDFERAFNELAKLPKNAVWGPEEENLWETVKKDPDLDRLRQHPEYGQRLCSLVRDHTQDSSS